MGTELTRCCGVDDDYYEQIQNTAKKGKDDNKQDSERKKIKRKLKTILMHKDPEFAKFIKTEKHEKLQNISNAKEEAILTSFAKNEISRELTWDILLSLAAKKYVEMELRKLKSKSSHHAINKSNTTTVPTDSNGDHKAMERDDESDSKLEQHGVNATNGAMATNGNTSGHSGDGEDDEKETNSIPNESGSGSGSLSSEHIDIPSESERKQIEDTVSHSACDGMKALRNETESEMLPLSTLQFRFPWTSLHEMVCPQNVDELMQCMQSAVNRNLKIRAMGSRYGGTNITFTDGVLIDMLNGLNRPKMDIDPQCFNKYGKDLHSQNNLVCCEAGATLKEIGDRLWPKGRRRYLVNKSNAPYKMIPDIPGFDQLCIGGVIQSGGYGLGTPYHYGSITNHVRSFQMLVVDKKTKKVKRIQVEPSKENAIHDPYKWCRMYPDIQLIQDDSCFHALLVSLGSCGVMYSVYIEVMNAHYLYERRYIMSWKQFKRKKWAEIDKKCKNGDIVRMQFHISPYLTYDKRYRESPPVVVNTYEYTEQMPSHRLGTDGGYHRSRDCERNTTLASLLATRFAHKWPRLVPFILQMSMESTCHSGIAISAADAVQFGNFNIVPTHKSGFGMKASHFTSIGDDYIRLCNILRAKCSKQIITQPVAVRFSDRGFGLLNFTYNEASVILEQSLYDFRNSIYYESENAKNVNGSGRNRNAVGDEMEERSVTPSQCQSQSQSHGQQIEINTTTTPKLWHTLFKIQDLCMGETYRGKPHLGLYFQISDQNIWKNHGVLLKEWMQWYCEFNAVGTFCNAFTKESGLDKIAADCAFPVAENSMKSKPKSGKITTKRVMETNGRTAIE